MPKQLGSILFVPPIRNKYWKKLPSLINRLEGIIFDLEDSIYFTKKSEARKQILKYSDKGFIGSLKKQNPNLKVLIRINNIRTQFFNDDINLISKMGSTIDGVMYPKAESKDELITLCADDNNVKNVFLVIETLKGFYNLDELIDSSHRVRWCALGAEDFCADLNIDRPLNLYKNPILSKAVSDVLLIAKLRDIKMYGNIWPYIEHENMMKYFKEECLIDCTIGMAGKVLFHPYQIDTVNDIFSDSNDFERMRRMLIGRLSSIARQAKETGLSVAIYNGRIVDMPEMLRLKKWFSSLNVEEKNQIENDLQKYCPEFMSINGDA